MDNFVVKYTGRGLVVKRPGVLSKVQILTLVLGVGVFSPLPKTLWIPEPGSASCVPALCAVDTLQLYTPQIRIKDCMLR